MSDRFGWGSTPLMHILTDTDIDAPGEGLRIWITDIVIQCAANTTLALNEAGGGSELTPALNSLDHTFEAPLKLEENTGVEVEKVGVGTAVIMIGYYIEGARHN